MSNIISSIIQCLQFSVLLYISPGSTDDRCSIRANETSAAACLHPCLRVPTIAACHPYIKVLKTSSVFDYNPSSPHSCSHRTPSILLDITSQPHSCSHTTPSILLDFTSPPHSCTPNTL